MRLLTGLWALTGAAWVVTVLGMLSIGIFVLPVAIGLLALTIVLTARRPEHWPAVAGLGLSLSAGLVWLGIVLARSGPSEISCSSTSQGVTTCLSGGRLVDPDAFVWPSALPWFVVAAAVAAAAAGGQLLARRHLTRDWVRSP